MKRLKIFTEFGEKIKFFYCSHDVLYTESIYSLNFVDCINANCKRKILNKNNNKNKQFKINQNIHIQYMKNEKQKEVDILFFFEYDWPIFVKLSRHIEKT